MSHLFNLCRLNIFEGIICAPIWTNNASKFLIKIAQSNIRDFFFLLVKKWQFSPKTFFPHIQFWFDSKSRHYNISLKFDSCVIRLACNEVTILRHVVHFCIVLKFSIVLIIYTRDAVLNIHIGVKNSVRKFVIDNDEKKLTLVSDEWNVH